MWLARALASFPMLNSLSFFWGALRFSFHFSPVFSSTFLPLYSFLLLPCARVQRFLYPSIFVIHQWRKKIFLYFSRLHRKISFTRKKSKKKKRKTSVTSVWLRKRNPFCEAALYMGEGEKTCTVKENGNLLAPLCMCTTSKLCDHRNITFRVLSNAFACAATFFQF